MTKLPNMWRGMNSEVENLENPLESFSKIYFPFSDTHSLALYSSGLISFFKCNVPHLHVPLMALIDYLGFRLIAISLVPIDKATIVYGSNDGGRSIHNTSKEFSGMMRKVHTA